MAHIFNRNPVINEPEDRMLRTYQWITRQHEYGFTKNDREPRYDIEPLEGVFSVSEDGDSNATIAWSEHPSRIGNGHEGHEMDIDPWAKPDAPNARNGVHINEQDSPPPAPSNNRPQPEAPADVVMQDAAAPKATAPPPPIEYTWVSINKLAPPPAAQRRPRGPGARYGSLTKNSPSADIADPGLSLSAEEWLTFFPQSARRADVCLYILSNPLKWGPTQIAHYIAHARGASPDSRPTVNKWINGRLKEVFGREEYTFNTWIDEFCKGGRRAPRSLPLALPLDGHDPLLTDVAAGVRQFPTEGEGKGVFTRVVEYALAYPRLQIVVSDAKSVAMLRGWVPMPVQAVGQNGGVMNGDGN